MRRSLWVLAALSAVAWQSSGAQPPAVVTQAPVDGKSEVAFHAMLFPRDIYIGQQASYQVAVFISQDARPRLRRNPEFIPPELRSMLGYDLPSRTTFSRVAEGRPYEVHVFQRAIFPLVAGRHAIAPARLSYSLPLSTSFFSREESRTLRAESLVVIAREPPAAGRPADYRGAVGVLTVERRVDHQQASVGTPFILTLAVRGVGNVALLPRPMIRLTWAQLVDGPERVQIDTTGPLVRGVKEFDFIVTPTTAGTHTLPAVRYAFFDPYAERYATAGVADAALNVARGTVIAATPSAAQTEAPLAIRRMNRGPLTPPVSSHPAYWLALATIPIPAAGLALVRRARRRAVRSTGYALHRLAGGNLRDAAAIRRALTAALGARLQIDAATLADPRRIVRALRRRGVTLETAREAAALHLELDAVVFGGEERVADSGLGARAAAVFDAIDREATRRPVTLGRIGAASLVVALTAGLAAPLAASMQGAGEVNTFDRGVALYESGSYAAAERVFSTLAAAQPRAADVWANAGTSAWQAHDTAAAALAWHRALRLDPMDAETRDRLDLIPAFRRGFFGDVPPVPLSLIAWFGLGAWLLAWGFQPVQRRWATAVSASAIVLAAGALVAGIRLSDIAHGRQTAIVRQSDRLRSGPSLGSDLAEEVMLGEAVRTPTARATWTFVRLADGRQGWLPTDRLVSLELRN